jgi:flavin reductase (DIM6/NTAB) family NADH-FMN oxidoreductase RutF
LSASAPTPAPSPAVADDLRPGDPRDPGELRRALGWFATGVTIATTLDAEGAPVGLTCNSFNSVSLEPPLVLWSLGRASLSRPAFERSRTFAINVLPAGRTELARLFSRAGADKWAGVEWTTGLEGVPRLPQALAVFECRVRERFQGGDHLIFLGEVAHMASREEGEPLLFLRGRFGRFAADDRDA